MPVPIQAGSLPRRELFGHAASSTDSDLLLDLGFQALCKPEPELAGEVLGAVRSLLDVDTATIVLTDAPEGQDGLVKVLAAELADGIQAGPLCPTGGTREALESLGLGSGIAAVIPGSGGPLGYLVAGSVRPRSYSPGDLQTLRIAAQAISPALQGASQAEELRRQESRFRRLTEHSNDVTTVFDRGGRILYASSAVQRLFGYRPEDRIEHSVFDHVHPDDAAKLRAAMEGNPPQPGDRWDIEFRYQAADSSWRIMRSSIVDLTDDPLINGFLANSHDVTRAREAQAALEVRERFGRALTEHASDIIALIDGDWQIKYVTGPYFHGSGWEHPAVGQHVAAWVHPEDREGFERELAALTALPGKTATFDCRLFNIHGRPFLVSLTVSNLLDDPAVQGIVVNGRDIDRQRRYEQRLLAEVNSRTALNALFAKALAGQDPLELMALACDLLAEAVDVPMAAVCELLPEGQEFLLRAAVGFPEGMVGTLTQPAAPGTSIVGHAVAEEATFVVEDLTDEPRIRRQQGLIALGAASAVVAPIKDRKGAYGALAIFSKVRRQFGPDDISMVEAVAHILTEAMARKQIEQRIEGLVDQLIVTQEEERRRVAYDVHDGLAQLAAATHQYLQAFAYDHRFRSERTRKELADILDLARRTVVDARRVIADLRPLVLDDFGLSVAVEHEVEALREAGWDAAFVDCLAGARLPATVETTLFRIAQECLNNIRKHAGRTRVAVSLALTANEARLVVQDEGAGFNMDSRAKSGPGERVGLMGMQERMRLLRGRLTVDSAVGRGTRVEAAVPVTLTMPEQPAAGEVAEMPVLTV